MKAFLSAAALVSLAIAVPAGADIVRALPGGTAVAMPVTQSFTADRTTFGPITYASTESNSVIGYDRGYGFDSNGSWSGGDAMAGLNINRGAMTFTFASAVSGVVADINWAGGYGETVTASIFDSSANLLETITFDGGKGNMLAPGFWGFSRTSNDISSLVLSNGYIGARSFSIETLAGGVPEPTTWALMILGMGAVGGAMRRRNATKARVAFA
ncbi:hypothetical protein ASG29_15760 [Sphingomonas sp. Leaf412]|uniref:PEPxxWA-CTERM sorting domain-containing protein n=1 Tax=Sphingomonas sp. Leaf412 TaxID=1736370 RepID=UPI0006FFD8F9|nr:PEPxxWA-CTERM sorting domain-containing protein [Sphingomonas sp. Leaf412]KQT31394.1 hypothetical protein ASG29_15760 [Sphingomonas sp. Leaf412]